MDISKEFEKSEVLEYQIDLNDDANRRSMTAKRELRRIEDIVHIRHLKRNAKKVLCIGARDDSELQTFLDAGFDEVAGIDIATHTDMIERMDMAELTPEFGTFDVIYCSHVLEHVIDPVETLRAIKSVARDLIFIILPIVNRRPDIEHPTVYEIMKYGPETKFKDFPQAWVDFAVLGQFDIVYNCYRNALTEEYEVAFILRLK